MRKNKYIFLLFIILTFFFTVSFKQVRLNTHLKTRHVPLHQKFQSLKNPFTRSLKAQRYSQDEILVKFKPTVSSQFAEATIAAYSSKKIKKIPKINIYQIHIPKNISVEEMLYAMNRNPDIEYAEPNYLVHMTVTPNDIYFEYQYALYNSGQSIGVPGSPQGKDRADIKATAAWEETKGKEDVIIAIIDTGVDLLHPELEKKVISGGRDFVNDDFDATDDEGHGTHVAGIAAADTNNNEGIAGVAWNCKILPVKVLDEEGDGYYSDIIDGIIWAADNEANVINLSLGGEYQAQALEEALKYAYDKDIVIVAAAGNDGGSVMYPAAYDNYCLAVAATDYNDDRVTLINTEGLREPWESNHGPEIDVAAPGRRILSCVPTWYWGKGSLPYGYSDGTSASVPQVSGLAALIKSIKPWLSNSEIMDVIRYSSDDVNSNEYSGNDEFIGYGRINMEKALVPIKISTSK